MGARIFNHIILTTLVTLILLAPDFIFAAFKPTYMHPTAATIKQVAIIWVLVSLILLIRSFWVRFGLLVAIAGLGFAQQIHFAYFHGYVKPYEIPLLFSQQDEIAETVSHAWSYMFWPIIFFGLQIALLYWVLRRAKTPGIRYIWIVVALALLAGPVVAYKRQRAYVFMPKAHALGIVNTYTSASYFLGKHLFKEHKAPHYDPYIVKELNITTPQNIIVIMGESVNEKYMSLFGFDKPSTPRLEELKSDPGFLYGKGYSCAVTTDVALPTFFLLKREPLNKNPVIDNRTNLMRLAKERGYTTTFITMQNPMLLSGYIGGFTDKMIAMKGYDEKLLGALEHIDWSKKNFVVLHMRNSHSPYEKYTPKRFWHFEFNPDDFHDYMFHTYLNSLRYTDYIITEVFKKIKDLNGSAVAFFTSDHGEMMGFADERGRYGHVVLDFADARVPFLVYHNGRIDPKLLPHLKKTTSIGSHYQFGKIIANTLGYSVHNPADDNATCYINGVDLYGERGYLKFRP
jgi:glucan phosphoethanolaminetransferase (alkaline phosphatase superfamily)